MQTCTLAILSDIHYASAAEQARGDGYETRDIRNPLLRGLVRGYRHFIWLRYPLRQNYLLDRFLQEVGRVDFVIANGDYSCDSANTGLSDDAAFLSAQECVGKLRRQFDSRLHLNFGDHELGKLSLIGHRGGMRLGSWSRALSELGLEPFWQLDVGRYALIGVVSSLIALSVFEVDTLADERPVWQQLREEHLAKVRQAFARLAKDRRILLFCHDPTALPFLIQEEEIRARLGQVEQTIIGHLHSPLVLWKSRLLSGMPPITFLGATTKRLSSALNQARLWKPFKVRLCPSLAGIELLKDGGFYLATLDPEARQPIEFRFQPLPRESA